MRSIRPPALLCHAGVDSKKDEAEEIEHEERQALSACLIRFPLGSRVHAAHMQGAMGAGEQGALLAGRQLGKGEACWWAKSREEGVACWRASREERGAGWWTSREERGAGWRASRLAEPGR